MAKLTKPQRALLMACHAAGNRFVRVEVAGRSGYRVGHSLRLHGLVQYGSDGMGGADFYRVKLTKEGRALARELAKGGV